MAQEQQIHLPESMDTSYTLLVSDGSGNLYLLSKGILTYDPVKPAMSSSGVYDGGDAWERAISKKQYAKIADAANTAIDAMDDQIADRLMGSFQLEIKNVTKGINESWIFAQNSSAIRDLEALLQKCR